MLTRIRFSERVADVGLTPCELRNLRHVVVLAGPNGSGKTRWLGQVEDSISKWNAEKSNVKSATSGDANVVLDSVPHAGGFELHFEDGVTCSCTFLKGFAAGIHAHTNPQGLNAIDTNKRLLAIPDLEPREVHQNAQIYLTDAVRTLFNADHPLASVDAADDVGVQNAKTFVRLLGGLLDSEISWALENGHPVPTKNGRTLATQELSDGEKLLLTWAVSLHCQDRKYRDQIILVDEPEAHVHPRAAIHALERLLEVSGERGQLWIATHSPAIVAHFGAESLYAVNDGAMSYKAGDVMTVMLSLLGSEDNIGRFSECLSACEMQAFYRFAAQCLSPPEVSDSSEDLQSEQLKTVLAAQGNAPIRLLDYGAGKGRFARGVAEWTVDTDSPRIDYYAYADPHHVDDRDECVREIARLYPEASSASSRYSTDIADFVPQDRQVAIIVMCNFLHEIPAPEWVEHLRNAHNALRSDGVLLVMEDLQPSVGELPHRDGFLILNLLEMAELLGDAGGIASAVEPENPRLSAILVSKTALATAIGPTGTGLRWPHTLATLQKRCLREIEKVRARDCSPPRSPHRQGRYHALLVLQYTNASIALSSMREG